MPELAWWKAAAADSWKVAWKDEPAPLTVPVAVVEVEAEAEVEVEAEELPLDDGVDDDEVLDEEEQAARARAAMTAPPATAACLLPRSCISKILLVDKAHTRNYQSGRSACRK